MRTTYTEDLSMRRVRNGNRVSTQILEPCSFCIAYIQGKTGCSTFQFFCCYLLAVSIHNVQLVQIVAIVQG